MPTPTPTSTLINCNGITVVEKASPQCEWISLTVCHSQGNSCKTISYGCQDYGFCNLTSPIQPQTKCEIRSNFCNWNTNSSTCSSACIKSVFEYFNDKSTPTHKRLGVELTDLSGTAIAGNGDGLVDIAIGSPGTPPKVPGRYGTGSVYVIFNKDIR